ncbi:cytochrome c3 family protein [Roseivivax sp. CAU 1761]
MTISRGFRSAALLAFAAASVGTAQEARQTPMPALEKDAATYTWPRIGPFEPAEVEITNEKAISDWFRSSHADAASRAFRHWDDQPEIPAACAHCHSGEGFRDFHGLDGTNAGVIDNPITPGGVVDCGTCHDPGLSAVREVTLPSGVVHPVQGAEASCLTCHQGRTSGADVERAIAGMPLDETSPELRFINPHYAVAAATSLGGYGKSGYEYSDRQYSGQFFHARPIETCNSCHDPHTLEVEIDVCRTCHDNNDFIKIRVARQSYDGRGNTTQGIRADINANAETLMRLIEEYMIKVAQAPVVYDGSRYPYFFEDANLDGRPDMTNDGPVPYANWTPRSLRAAFNWKFVTADSGNYAHNPPYALELLYDTIFDLAEPLGTPAELTPILR